MNTEEDDTIRATILAKMHTQGFYEPRAVSVDGLVSMLPIQDHQSGRATELVHELARADASPVIYKQVDQSVMLEVNSDDWVEATIRRYDESQLPTGLGDDLRIIR